MIPILVGAWLYGMWAGLLLTVSLYVLDILLAVAFGWENIQIAIHSGALLGAATGAIISLIVGRLGEMNRRHQEEFRQQASLLQERQDAALFLNLLNDIMLAAMDTNDMQSMLNILAQRTGDLFKTDSCYITFWDGLERKTIPIAAYGPLSQTFFERCLDFKPNERTLTSAVVDSGKVVAIDDIRHSLHPLVNEAKEYSIHSVLGIPLVSGDRKLGALLLAFRDHRHFSEGEIEHGELAARQISLAVTKALLLKDTRERVQELAGLHSISQAFSLHGNPEKTFGLLTKTLANLFKAEMCVISLYNPATDTLQAQEPAYGLEDNLMASFQNSIEMGKKIWEFSGSPYFKANSEAEIPAELIPPGHSFAVKCILVAPLWDSENRLFGIIYLANKPGGFTDNDVHLVEILARQVTAVIQNGRLLNAERTRAEQLAVLHAVAAAATEAVDEDDLIEGVTLIIGQRLYSDSFGILLLDDLTNELYLHSSYRIGSHEGLSRVPMGIGITGKVARSGKPYRVDDVSASTEYLSLYPLTRSELCVPLKVEEKLLGVVNAESKRVGAFTKEDEELLTIIAGQMATTIQRLRTVHAERYQTRQLERSNSLIRALSQVNARAAAASDPDGVLQTLGGELGKLGMRCAVALSNNPEKRVTLRYISLPDRLIRALERVSRIKMQDYSIAFTDLSPDSELPQKACLVNSPMVTLKSWVQNIPDKTASKILKLIDISTTTSICYLPLIIEGKPMGVLWMWGEGLHESDIPTVSLFASQVAAALQNANLLTEVGRLAITDELTGIFNRRHFFEMAEKRFERAQKYNANLSALIVDIDHFKRFNDQYGHAVGDQVLREAASRMCSALRESDIIGRYGGEEFSILLPETNLQSAVHVAERLMAHVSNNPIDTDAGKLSIQISIGAAGMNQDTPDLHSLIIRSDQAMYLAKNQGRNRVAVNPD
ncbi:MAG TPA: diguanylate cyclase [Anaerolineales bacterium]|nr:diguanylate cyclase [Anaerolineales bacterium]